MGSVLIGQNHDISNKHTECSNVLLHIFLQQIYCILSQKYVKWDSVFM